MSNPTIEAIRSRLNLVDVVSSYVPLKKAGVNFKANCPFHHERTSSFIVSPGKQIWHCFGCGEGGDVFGFVMKYENLEFAEALKILADKAGVQLPRYSKADAKADLKRKTLLHINDLSAKFYNKVLEKSSLAAPARKYLKERRLSPATIKEWQIGFAPDSPHLLEDFLKKKNFSKEEMLAAGVVLESSKNPGETRLFDRFLNRITFPIRSYAGDVVAFTARIIDPAAKAAKYINSPETPIYSKSKIIFGLYEAKQEIRKRDCAIIVEGNMDVIASHQAGFKNVVASSGTAFTTEQLATLSRLTKNLKFAFDADAAGQSATRRTLESALQLGFNVYILDMHGAKDPDELIKSDPKAFEKAIQESQLYMDYFFERSFADYDPSSVQKKKQVLTELIPLIQKLADPLDIEHYVKALASRMGTVEKVIYEILSRQRTLASTGARTATGTAKPLLKNRSYFLEEKLLGYALFGPDYKEKILAELELSEFRDPKIRSIFEWLQTSQSKSQEDFIAGLGGLSELAKLALFMVESEHDQTGDERVFERQFAHIFNEFKTNAIKIKISAVMGEMVLAEQRNDKILLSNLNQKFLQLAQALKAYGHEK